MELPVLNRQHNSVAVESWDDDDELQGVLELKSSALSVSGPRSKTDRESISSRMSFISDTGFDFDDEPQEKVLLAPEGDSTRAIESAKMAGIPLPLNIPASALKGGTIKRLGTKKATMVEHDDWSEDLELPLGGLAIKTAQFTDFPGSIKYSPQQMRAVASRQEPVVMSRVPANVSKAADKLNTQLNKYREDDDDENWDGDDIPTLKVAGPPLSRNPFGLASPPLTEIKSKPAEDSDDDFGFDDDFELPEGKGLQLKHPQARSPAALMDSDFEEWIEGSRNQGTSVRARSTRSSSISMSSVQNFDSEDEGMDGLQFPEGPIDFEEILAKRKQNETPDLSMDFELEKKGSKEDFLTGLEIGDVDFLDPSKLTLNRNVKHKTTRQASPVRRTAVALTFSSPPPPHEVSAKISSVGPTRQTKPTRLPGSQLSSTSIVEPPVQSRQKKPEQRPRRISNPPAVDHNAFAFGAMGSFFHPHPTPPPSVQGGSGTRRLVKRTSQSLQQSPPPQLAQPPTTTSAQLLKVKRSMQSIARLPPTSPTRIARPSSRSETPTTMAVLNAIRSTTPTDRAGGISQPVQSRRTFIPGGSAIKQSPTVNVKTAIPTRPANRVTVDETEKTRPSSRISNSRPARTTPPPPSRIPQPTTLETLKKDAAATRLMTRPAKKKNFGDGTELEAFDDLPTSQKAEQKFVKEPIAKGAPRCLRAKAIPTQTPPPPATPPVTKSDSNIPSFARDTNASRTAREQKMAALASSPAAKHWKNMMAAREKGSPRTRAAAKKPQQRPHLIKPLGNQSSIAKAFKGMTYNPRTFRWEGNEHSLEDFDRHQAITPPRPALITNINSNSSGMPKGFQVVGGMVFDPQRMCWLKADADEDGGEESDPFEGLEDLRDELASCDGTNVSGLGTSCGEFMVGEEFDVGPEFVRRQREEEERWRRRVDGWVSGSVAGMVGMRDPQSEWRRRWELWNIVVNN